MVKKQKLGKKMSGVLRNLWWDCQMIFSPLFYVQNISIMASQACSTLSIIIQPATTYTKITRHCMNQENLLQSLAILTQCISYTTNKEVLLVTQLTKRPVICRIQRIAYFSLFSDYSLRTISLLKHLQFTTTLELKKIP